jgi:TPR repeat protein
LKKAKALLTKSAEQGHAEAQYALANMYNNGDGVAKDAKKGFEWLAKAAEQGDVEAQSSVRAWRRTRKKQRSG